MNDSTNVSVHPRNEWRCDDCGKLLGILRDGRLYIRFSRGPQYLVGFPATSSCPGCGAMNEHRGPSDR